MGDDDIVLLSKGCNLPHWHPQIGELLLDCSFLTFADQGIATQGNEQCRFGTVAGRLVHGILLNNQS